MPPISQDINVIPPFDEGAAKGYANTTISTDLLVIGIIYSYVVVLLVIHVSVTAQKFLSKKINPTEKGKSRLYFQYWSVISLGIILICNVSFPSQLFIVIIVTSISTSLCNYLVLFILFGICKRNSSYFLRSFHSSPATMLSFIPCDILCGLYSHAIISCLLYILAYAIPNIIVVYYLYPVSTIKRLSFIISGLFSIVTLTAYFIYLLEKTVEVLQYMGKKPLSISCCKKCKRDKDYYHFSYYAKEILADAKENIRSGYPRRIVVQLTCIFLFLEITLLAGVITIYCFVQLVLAKLVFDRANSLASDNGILIAFIPTILMTVISGAATGIFKKFDIFKNKYKNKIDQLLNDHQVQEDRPRGKQRQESQQRLIKNYSELDELISLIKEEEEQNFNTPQRHYGAILNSSVEYEALPSSSQLTTNVGVQCDISIEIPKLELHETAQKE